MNVIDPQGDTIRVESQYQEMFISVLQSVFGDTDAEFSFTSAGYLQFSGNYPKMNKLQK